MTRVGAHDLRPADRTQAQIEIELLSKPRRLRSNLPEQSAAYRTRTEQADRDGLGGKVETAVHGTQRAGHILCGDHGGDVALGGTLRDRSDVDPGVSERAEEAASAAGQARHALADHCDDAALLGHVDLLYLPLR